MSAPPLLPEIIALREALADVVDEANKIGMSREQFLHHAGEIYDILEPDPDWENEEEDDE